MSNLPLHRRKIPVPAALPLSVVLLASVPGCQGDPQSALDDPAVARRDAAPVDDVSVSEQPQAKVQMSIDAFLQAAADGKLDTIATAIESGMEVNSKDTADHTALHLAAYEGRTQLVEFLLAQGADVELPNRGGQTALAMAAYNGHSDVVELLLEQGASVDAPDREGKTPLIHACTGPFRKTVELLIENGADINARDTAESFTPLMMAAGLGETEVVKVLLRNDVDIALRDADNESALDHARKNNHTEIIDLLSAH